MDTLSHGLFFIGVFLGFQSWPDRQVEPPGILIMPSYVYVLYNLTHSFIVYGLFFALLWWLGKKDFAKLTLGWPLHILVDIPTHAIDFFPTHFLWPLANFSINGAPWTRPVVLISNFVLLASLYGYWYWKRRKER